MGDSSFEWDHIKEQRNVEKHGVSKGSSQYGSRTGIRELGLLAPAIGGKENRFMKKKIKYIDEPIGKIKVVSDFLPRPDELILKEETVKVTLALTKESVEFFKREAEENDTQYQKMIRVLVDQYAEHYRSHPKRRKYA